MKTGKRVEFIIFVIEKNPEKRKALADNFAIELCACSLLGKKVFIELGSIEEAEKKAEEIRPTYILFLSKNDDEFKERAQRLVL